MRFVTPFNNTVAHVFGLVATNQNSAVSSGV